MSGLSLINLHIGVWYRLASVQLARRAVALMFRINQFATHVLFGTPLFSHQTW